MSGLVVSHRRAHGLTTTGKRLLTLSECYESKGPRDALRRLGQAMSEGREERPR